MKIGDTVEVLNDIGRMSRGPGTIISPVPGYGEPVYKVQWGENFTNGNIIENFYEESLRLINYTKTMNIKEKFSLAFKSEPEKSFRKAGITNGDDFLTDDGQKIFLSFLLKKYGIEFKKDIVDELLKDEDKSEK